MFLGGDTPNPLMQVQLATPVKFYAENFRRSGHGGGGVEPPPTPVARLFTHIQLA
jgi:hypothetical protein